MPLVVSSHLLLYIQPFTLQVLNFCFVVVVFREPDTGLASEMVAGQETRMLDNDTRMGLYHLLNGTANSSNSSV